MRAREDLPVKWATDEELIAELTARNQACVIALLPEPQALATSPKVRLRIAGHPYLIATIADAIVTTIAKLERMRNRRDGDAET